MRTGTIIKCLASMLFLCVGTIPMSAQKNIDKVVEELEKRDGVNISLVTNRNPQTREITNKIKTLSITDEKIFEQLVKAFEKDEEYTRTAMREDKNKNGIHLVITEYEAKGHKFYNAAGEEMECTALMKELGLNAVQIGRAHV